MSLVATKARVGEGGPGVILDRRKETAKPETHLATWQAETQPAAGEV